MNKKMVTYALIGVGAYLVFQMSKTNTLAEPQTDPKLETPQKVGLKEKLKNFFR